MSNEPFRFKQFAVEQHHAALKVNTDAVLLGALACAAKPKTILDIGTGSGVIALMLAQRFAAAQVEAVEINDEAAHAAKRNFENSPFADRLQVYSQGFSEFFEKHPQKKYDLIVSNPPFFLNALLPEKAHMTLSKHTGEDFFKTLFSEAKHQLQTGGEFWLILPPDVHSQLKPVIASNSWHHAHFTHVFSQPDKPEFRTVIQLRKELSELTESDLLIRDHENAYTPQYAALLKDFLTIF